MAAISASDLNDALKIYYKGQLNNVVFGSEDRPLFNMLTKDESFVGLNMPVPVYFEDAAGGRSATFSNAQTNSGTVSVSSFDIDVVENHQVVQISTDALLRGRSDKGTFLKNQILRIDNALNNLANDIETALYRDGSGSIGTIGSISTDTITLSDADDARNFYVGQVLVSANDTSSAINSGSVTVAAVDYINGTVQCTGNVTTGISSAQANELLFTQGDYTDSTTLKITGLDGWLTGSGTLFGVDRSAHSRLQGIAGTGSLADIKKAITDNAALAKMYASAKLTHCFLGWDEFSRLVDQLEADVQRSPGGTAVAGYSFVEVYGPSGAIKVVGATHCPNNQLYLLDMSTWKLVSMGPVVRVNNDDGLAASRLSSAAGLEIRCDSHSQLACSGPGKNVRVTLS